MSNLTSLVLILGLLFNIVSCHDNEETELENDAKEEPKTDPDDEPKEQVEMTRDAEVDDCNNPSNETKALCCKKDHLRVIEDRVLNCYTLHKNKEPKKHERNRKKLIKFYSCLVKCAYQANKYIGKANTMNMKKVRSDAKKMYKDSEKDRKYIIEMYKYCEKKASIQWANFKKNPEAVVILTGGCNPYYMLVYRCTLKYSEISCPYFRWKTDKCDEMKKKCEQLHASNLNKL